MWLRGGGGGGTSIRNYHWVCATRETPIFSPEFPFRSISFSQITKKSVPEHHHFTFFGGFCRSGDHHWRLQNVFNFNPFSTSQMRPGSSGDSHFHARIKLVPEPHIFKLKTAQVRSGAPHFQAQNGPRSFRSPAFSRSTGSSFRSPGPFFTLPRHIPTKIWGEYPPPPLLRHGAFTWRCNRGIHKACIPWMLRDYIFSWIWHQCFSFSMGDISLIQE